MKNYKSDRDHGVHPFKVEVIADSSGMWAGNGVSYDTVEAAVDGAQDLFARWTAVREWRVNSIGGVAAKG
jgi:hypothetical protein